MHPRRTNHAWKMFYRKSRGPEQGSTSIKIARRTPSIKKSPDDFSLLGLTTNRNSQLLSVKGKPISFKSRAKGTVDITIRNPQEFSNFLHQGGFQRQHMSSMLSQVFDPSFIFNAVYHNVARLINRRIVKSVSKTMPMTYKIKKEHSPLLEELSQLFFETQML